LRSWGSKSDPYAVFKAMLDQGNPPDGWDTLTATAKELPSDLQAELQGSGAEE